MTEKQQPTKQPDVTLEEDDAFEDFPLEEHKESTAEEQDQQLWQADWDDEDVTEDFQSKLRKELGRHMQE